MQEIQINFSIFFVLCSIEPIKTLTDNIMRAMSKELDGSDNL